MMDARSAFVVLVAGALLSACGGAPSPSMAAPPDAIAAQALPAQTPPVQAPPTPPAPSAGPTATAPVPEAPLPDALTGGEVTVAETETPSGAKAPPPVSRPAAVKTSQSTGMVGPEVIRRVVRQERDKFVACYRAGLRKDPTLNGRVTVHFVIAKNGATRSITLAGGDLTEKSVTQCVARELATLKFPPPDHGELTVTFPFSFSQADLQPPGAAAK